MTTLADAGDQADCDMRMSLGHRKLRDYVQSVKSIHVMLASCLIAAAGCSSGGSSPSAGSLENQTTGDSIEVDVAEPTTTELKVAISTTPTTSVPPAVTDDQRELVFECVGSVWGTSGNDEAEFDYAREACSDNADALDVTRGVGAGQPLRDMMNTNIAWLRGEVSDSDYPGLLFTQTIALRDTYYPENDSVFTDNTNPSRSRRLS
jgi:hypothetical protein